MKVHSTAAVVLLMPGGPQAVAKDEGVEDDDPRVLAYPWLFGLTGKRKRVEQATANPGELR